MAKARPQPKKQSAVVSLEEMLNTPRPDNPFGLANFLQRFKYRIGKKEHSATRNYRGVAGDIIRRYRDGQDQVRAMAQSCVLPPLAFAVLRKKK